MIAARPSSRRALLRGALALPLLGWAAPALAHRVRLSRSVVTWGREGFDVVHGFHRHDAETALARAGLLDAPDMSGLRARAHLALHVEETFSLGEGVPLQTLGAEVVAERVEVYQVATLDTLPETLDVRASMLRGLWPDQVNAVDVHLPGGVVRSLRFAGDDARKPLALT